jgi:hypothetical protein
MPRGSGEAATSYAIVSEADLAEGVRKVAALRENGVSPPRRIVASLTASEALRGARGRRPLVVLLGALPFAPAVIKGTMPIH